MKAAPLYHDISEGPDDGAAFWITTGDDVRLRIAVWGMGAANGTVLLFPGRTEYAEKYGRAAHQFRDRGFATVVVDWRGQGLADRLHRDPTLGHVDRFTAYQRDVAAVVAAAGRLGLPTPLYLVAHSMGGAIGLRALHEGLGVSAAVFSAPMWGIAIPRLMRPAAWTISAISRPLGLGTRFTPGTGGNTYLVANNFDENDLTGDPEMFGYMRNQVIARPELTISGPSLAWLHEALTEIRTLTRRRPPALPTLTYLGTDERIVCPNAIHGHMQDWRHGALQVIEGARHEVLMEGPEIRARVFDEIAEHFARHRETPEKIRLHG
ncbi:Lysophospholipase L2 [Rhodovulum sp. P5]|uniref:alpha/beta fold hydrolase n=1 Tax=Rhodovulum sp. P5 TaxID=1564506 RepID=UPI0009C38AD8|nr:alpha/beta hydrolase [Rhodovulum sp. P5]ARE40066.1 Lysophospholipase L2 [Rhodovulum sp. P5]